MAKLIEIILFRLHQLTTSDQNPGLIYDRTQADRSQWETFSTHSHSKGENGVNLEMQNWDHGLF